MSSSRPAIHGNGEKPIGASMGMGGGAAGLDVAGATFAALAGPRRVGRAEIGSSARVSTGWLGRAWATNRAGAGRGAVEVAAAGGRAPGSRSTITGVWTAGWRSAGRVTVPFKLKFDSSRGPILPGAADGGALAVELSCAASGAPASSNAAARPERKTKPLTLLAKFESPSPTLGAALARFARRFKAKAS